MPAISKSHHISEPMKNQDPNFHQDVLRSLTENVESKLKFQSKGPSSKDAAARPKTNSSGIKRRSGEHLVNVPVSTSTVRATNNGSTPIKKRNPTIVSKMSQGKKRSRDGHVKDESDGAKGKYVNKFNIRTGTLRTASDHIDRFNEDVRALGGTREDVDLTADVKSESEMEGEAVNSEKNQENVETEISQLIRQLGVDKLAKQDMLADSETEEADEVGELHESWSPDETSSNKRPISFKSASSTTITIDKGHRSLIFQPQSEWLAVELPSLPLPSQKTSILPPDLLDRLHNHAKALLEYENAQYANSNRSVPSAHQFYSTVMSTGTLSDKISALTLSVQESPVHNMKALEGLISLASKRSRGQAVEVLGALKDLFGPGNLLPSDRKLRAFANQPALSNAFGPLNLHWTSRDPLPGKIEEIHLVSWAYEDWLKSTFFEVLIIIETWCNDEVVFVRSKAVDYVCQLLKAKPEQEANLLRLLVNKLGDSDKKIASKTSFSILQLEAAHPLMKPTIIAAIESELLFRPSQSLHAKYYASITLNQTVLSGKEGDVARKLLDIYFSLFIKLLESLDGVKPAATDVSISSINKKGEVQGGGGFVGKKALKKLAEEQKATTADEDLKEKMLSAVLTGVNRAIPFTDTSDELFERQLDTLFKVTHSSNFNTSTQALMLIQQLNRPHQGSMDRFYRTLYESLFDARLLMSSKQTLYLNLLFRALRSDLNVKRIKAFEKRLLQVVAMHQPSFICGTLYLLGELESINPHLEVFIDQREEDSGDEENFRDVEEQLPNRTIAGRGASSQKINTLAAKYDGRKRDPKHSNADRSSLWEATLFLQHYHPSVALFATRLLTHNGMPPKPDLSMNTLIHFLDRFVYRNPKATNAPRGASIMQPMAGGDSSALLVSAYSGESNTRQPVNSEAFWKQASEKVNADEVFFHKYFSTFGRGKGKTGKKKTQRKAEAEDSEDGADEDEIWEALMQSKPELDEGSDSGFGDENAESEMDEMNHDELKGKTVKVDESARGNLAGGPKDLLELDDDDHEVFLDSDDDSSLSDLEGAFDEEVTSSKPNSTVKLEKEKHGSKRRRLRDLPTFASVDEYAKLLDEDE